MRNAMKVGLFICVSLILSSQSVGASSLSDTIEVDITDDPLTYLAFADQTDTQKNPQAKLNTKSKDVSKKEAKPEPAPQPEVYTVISGDSLTSIAKAHEIEWRRLFDKNAQIADPNTISVGEQITIPFADEQLEQRQLPVSAPVVQSTQASGGSRSSGAASTRQYSGSSAGNTYAPGYCTWYAKNRRPDLPNQMGNAGSWVASAAARGFATGSAPRAGAIGQQGNHVVYIESVNGDGTVTVSEMNWSGLFVVSSRTVPASYFRYIY
ncbi:LysM peptidoglycan-binding domain-containing protein [Candidatus Saccharibacteria bacterium]|nr:LysM peptidoglycan-binding domain-containing protein [Candidatus Saccharibacteria bacterium]